MGKLSRLRKVRKIYRQLITSSSDDQIVGLDIVTLHCQNAGILKPREVLKQAGQYVLIRKGLNDHSRTA